MSFKLKALPLALAHVIAGGALTVAMAPAMAQSSDSGAPVQRVEITGSNIRRADAETPSPVQVITADDLKKSGFTTVAQVLQNITANGQGTLSQGFSQAFAGGASGLSLRGLTTAATLVLIDGHRMAPYPLSDDGQRQFVDISNIPFDTIERIEVLKDGASATYGSDAMAGVVNIILKKNYVGTQVAAEGGTATEGGGTTYHASVTSGMGNLDSDGYNAYFSLEYRHQDHITLDQRSGDGLWQNLNWTAYGGLDKRPGAVNQFTNQPINATNPFLTPTTPGLAYGPTTSYFYPGACTYAKQQADQCVYQNPLAEIQPRTANLNVLGSFTKKLDGDWQIDLKASMFESKSEQYAAGSTFNYPSSFSPAPAVSAGVAPHVILPTIGQISVPAGYPGNPFGTSAFLNGVVPDAPYPNTQYDSKAYRVVADLTGTLGSWDIDTSLGYTKVNLTQDDQMVNEIAFNTALNAPNGSPGQYLVGGPNSKALLNSIFPISSAFDTSLLEFAEFHASRSLAQLPGGDLGFSTGLSYSHREMNSPAPELAAEGYGGNNAYVTGTQNDASAYAEIAAPVLKGLEIDGSLRYDQFSGDLKATTPKLGFKWTPSDMFALRGTASKGFRAPNSAESGQSGQAYLYNTTYDPVLCPGGLGANGKPPAGSVAGLCSYQPVYLNESNPKLAPEKSHSETLGLILEPIKGWGTTIDLYQITIADQIVAGSANPNDYVRGSPVTTLCGDGNGGTYSCTPAVGPILYYPVSYVNANSTKTSGIELDTKYKFRMKEYGNLTAELNWSHIMSYTENIGGTVYQFAGTHGPIEIGGDTGTPKDRQQVTFTWEKGPLEIATTFNRIGSFNLTDASQGLTTCDAGASVGGEFPNGGVPAQFCTVKAFLDTDVSFKYVFDKHWTVHGAITNLFNQAPPVDLDTYGGTQIPYNPSMHMEGAIGRFVNVGASYKF
jgi:iron complex outermembrane receptor protein